MRCSNCDSQLSDAAKFCSECGTAVTHEAPTVHTSGGPYIGGAVTAGRDSFVASTIHGGIRSGLAGEDLTRFAGLFQSVYAKIDEHAANDPDADPQLLKDTAKQVEQEVAKGKDADPGKVKRALTTLARLAPDVVEVAVNAITNPGAAVVSAVKIVAEEVREWIR